MRSDSEAIAVNLPDVEPVEKPETVKVSIICVRQRKMLLLIIAITAVDRSNAS